MGYSQDVSDSAFEYAGVPAERFAMWEDILQDVGFARGYGPAHGKPGFEDYQLKATQALVESYIRNRYSKKIPIKAV